MTRSSSRGSAAPRRSLPRSKRHSRAQQPILDDARDVLQTATRYHKSFRDYDAKRAHKLLPKSRLTAFAILIREGATLVGGGRTRKALAKTATRAEHKARVGLFEILVEVRGLVSTAVTDDGDMREAFLVGAKLRAGSTPDVVKAAADVQQAWKDPKFHERAVALGVDKAVIARIVAARRQVTSADTGQHGQMDDKKEAATGTVVALRRIERETAYFRKVAKLVFRTDPKTRVKFATKVKRAIARGPNERPQATSPVE
jgi:hypothetical protein